MPFFSVLTPVYNPPLSALAEAIESVRRQTFEDWELVLVDDHSSEPGVRALLDAAAAGDCRIKVTYRFENGGISASSQQALELATGEFCALLDHDDALAPHALARVAEALAEEPDVDYVYTDEDKLDPNGRLFDTFAKPDWSPERLRSQMYTAHLSVLRTGLARAVGGFRQGYEGSQDHDLALRVTEQARAIVHIPEVLYHWRLVPGSTAVSTGAKPQAVEAGRRAVEDQVHRVGIDAHVSPGEIPGTYRVERRLDAARSVSIVIPTRGGSGIVWGEQRCFVVEAVRSALAHTEHPNIEIVIVADIVTPPEVIAELEDIAGDQLVIVEYAEKFNFSRKCNAGYVAATGDFVVFLNDDVEVITDGWLESLVAPLEEPGIGMVGAKLLYADGTVQHGGHLYHQGGYTHAFLGAPADSLDYFFALHIGREVLGVTAACAAVSREMYEEIGGFCEELPANFNDVDLSFKAHRAGYRMLYLGQVELYHFESRTRIARVQAWEIERMHRRWATFDVDPYLPTRSNRGDYAVTRR
jgi:glycosyltransferase involved in cell wall biosynthesis